MVYRIYVEKKQGFDHEAQTLLGEAKEFLEIGGVKKIRVINRYDAEGMEKALFDDCVKTVFSEPQMDVATEEINVSGAKAFAVEYLPGQFDQRADSAAQCIQLISQKERPTVRTAKIYAVYGSVSDEEFEAIKKYVINPVESREAGFEKPETLQFSAPVPQKVPTVSGFLSLTEEGAAEFAKKYALA
ncbi:MAG: phosphoribosylformylglycinamidine synthase, partial [Candidatus Scatosoma sp.]